MTQILIIGHSHIGALYKAFKQKLYTPSLNTKFICLAPNSVQPFYENGQFIKFTDTLQLEIANYLAEEPNTYIFALFAGVSHLAMSLTPDPRGSFDFVVPGHEYLPDISGSRIIPYNNIKEALYKDILPLSLQPLLELRKVFPKVGLYQIDAPPPIPDGQYILSCLKDKHLSSRISKLGLSPSHYRLKYWLIQSQILSEFCKEKQIGLCPVPPEMIDDEGYMIEKAWSNDGVHANELYGLSMLQQIEAITKRISPL